MYIYYIYYYSYIKIVGKYSLENIKNKFLINIYSTLLDTLKIHKYLYLYLLLKKII